MKYLITVKLACLLILLLLSSCTNFDKKNITIIENVVLGKPTKEMGFQFDSLGLNKSTYFTQSLFKDLDDIDENIITT
jgi:hypothetical protein